LLAQAAQRAVTGEQIGRPPLQSPLLRQPMHTPSAASQCDVGAAH
jgi:hypothetical protein